MSFRNPFERIETRSQAGVISINPSFVQNGTLITPDGLVSADEALKNSDLYTVISLISSDIAAADFKGDGKGFINMLNSPSEISNRYNFWQTVIVNVLLSGNSFVKIDREGRKLRLIPTSAVIIDLSNDKLTYEVRGYDDYLPEKVSYENMFHFKIMAYSDGEYIRNLIGHSPLESLTSEIELQKQANRLSLSTLMNGLNPTSKITVPEGTLSPEAKDTIRDEFQKAVGGKNAGKALVLDQSASFEVVSINADVAKYLENMDWNRTQIAKAFGVPDSYLNGAGDAQSSLEMITQMYVNGLNRFIEPILSEINHKLDSNDIRLDMSDIMDYSGAIFRQDIKDYVDKGILSPEDAFNLLKERNML
ncbi:phage protein [Weissella oryzae SG25]|uniref:Phage protein n=1 Tax=Weissella oryzae (strain DSM 25784 / JCM 18191 / LMG 30913 / SG25) TaxID=1329250 RepID=A0A069CS48_WEIOS|nr:phage portal protein [Weissella oryzae]GAK30212.1 phage protein [Weissella oryzae SG25]